MRPKGGDLRPVGAQRFWSALARRARLRVSAWPTAVQKGSNFWPLSLAASKRGSGKRTGALLVCADFCMLIVLRVQGKAPKGLPWTHNAARRGPDDTDFTRGPKKDLQRFPGARRGPRTMMTGCPR